MSKPEWPIKKSSQRDQNPETDSPALAIALQWSPGFVARLLRDLPRIRDSRMRALALGERLQALSTDDIITVARRLHDELMHGNEIALDVLSCFRDTVALEDRLGRERMAGLAAAAKLEGQELAAVMIAPMEPLKGGGTRTHRDLREYTLGERKALAKTHKKEILVKLLEDDHPHVQHNLLTNPRLTAREVVSVAAKRPALPHILRGIAKHPRWMHNFEVRRALAKNPDTPVDVSGRIVVTLPKTDLIEIAKDDRLPKEVRDIAAKRLERLKGIENQYEP